MRAVLEVFPFYSQFLQDRRFLLIKCKFYRPCVSYPASGLLQIGHKSEKWQWRHSFPTRRHCQLFWCQFFFMSISLLVLEIWQFSFIRDWPEIRKSEIPAWTFPSIWRLGWVMDTIFGMNVTECCKNARVKSFTISGLLKENTQVGMGGGGLKLLPPRLGLICNCM